MTDIGMSETEALRGRQASEAGNDSLPGAVDRAPSRRWTGDRAGDSPWRPDALRRRMLALADLVSALATGAVMASSATDLAWAAAASPLWLVTAKLLGLYDRDHRAIRHLTVDELPALAAWAFFGVVILVVILPITPAGSLPPDAHGGIAEVAIAGYLTAIGSVVVLRGTARFLWRRITPPERTLVIGEGEPAKAIHRRARLFADMHLQLISEKPLPIAVLEAENWLASVTQRTDRIIFASTEVDQNRIGELSAACRAEKVKLSVISPLRGRALPALRMSKVADLPVFEFNTWDPSRSTIALKRVFDLLFSSLALLITAPLFPLIVLAIRLDSRGRAIFAQQRAGVAGVPFRLYKFRTMRADAEQQLATVVDLDQLEEPMFKLDGDPRVTRVGRLLRRLSLDELPQLYNVLRGDMSIVGPRPEQMELVQRYRPEHRFRLAVKPGLTGPMQIYGRGELTFAERLSVELDYVDNLSLAQDLKILATTVPVVLRGRGAY
jgi:exopolysaccharide biosynthesis polyprenyl glycosylphosphotransferase